MLALCGAGVAHQQTTCAPYFLVTWLFVQLSLVQACFRPPVAKVLALSVHSQRSALQCGNQVTWVSGTLGIMFLPKVGFAVPPNYAFKPTAGEVCRSNQALLAGGGLTRR
jgi:hypothetical protein